MQTTHETSHAATLPQSRGAKLRAHWAVFVAAGLVLLVAGFTAMAFPFFATLAAELVVGGG